MIPSQVQTGRVHETTTTGTITTGGDGAPGVLGTMLTVAHTDATGTHYHHCEAWYYDDHGQAWYYYNYRSYHDDHDRGAGALRIVWAHQSSVL